MSKHERKIRRIGTELKNFLELVRNDPTFYVAGNYRISLAPGWIIKKINLKEPESFKIILHPDREERAFSFFVPVNRDGFENIGDVVVKCSVANCKGIRLIKIDFDLYCKSILVDRFELFLVPQSHGEHDDDSFHGLFEIQPVSNSLCVLEKFKNIEDTSFRS